MEISITPITMETSSEMTDNYECNYIKLVVGAFVKNLFR
jgi:hypothetical protein